MAWKTISSALVFDHRWYKVRRDVIEFADGRRDEYFVSARPEVVIVVPIDRDGRIVLVRQYKHAAGERTLEFPAGTLDAADAGNPEAGARRELLEETGRIPGRFISLGRAFEDATKNTNAVHFFLATDCEATGQQTLDDNEKAGELEIVTMTIEDLMAAMADGTLCALSSLAAAAKALPHLSGRRWPG